MSVNHLVQCHIYRSSNPKGELPKPTDPSVVRIVRIAKPFVDTAETILKCLGDSVPPSITNNGRHLNSTSSNFLQPIVEYLDQANLQYITFMSSSSSSSPGLTPNNAFHVKNSNDVETNEKKSAEALKSKLRGVNDLMKKYDVDKKSKGGEGGADGSSPLNANNNGGKKEVKSVDEQIRQVLASHGKANVVHVAFYPAFSDGTCDLSSVSDEQYEGPLKLKEPLLEQLEKRNGIPLLPNSSLLANINSSTNNNNNLNPAIAAKRRAAALNAASSVITLAIVLVVESTDEAVNNKKLQRINSSASSSSSPLRLNSFTSKSSKRRNSGESLDNDDVLSVTSSNIAVLVPPAAIRRRNGDSSTTPEKNDKRKYSFTSSVGGLLNSGKNDAKNSAANLNFGPLIDGIDPLQFANDENEDNEETKNDISRKLDLRNDGNLHSTTLKPVKSFTSVSFRNDVEENDENFHHHDDDDDNDDMLPRRRLGASSFGSFIKFGSFVEAPPTFSHGNDINNNNNNNVSNQFSPFMMSPAMAAARKRRLEQLRLENIAKMERRRAEEEYKSREQSVRYEKDRIQRIRLEKDIRHQAELAHTRQQIRELELEKKRKLYETRELDLNDEKKEFHRRLDEYSTIAQIESLKAEQEADKASAKRRKSNEDHQHFLQFQQSKIGTAKKDNSQQQQLLLYHQSISVAAAPAAVTSLPSSASSGNRIFASRQIGEAEDTQSDKKLSLFVENNLDGLVQQSVVRSTQGDQNLAEQEVERGKQQRQIYEQRGLNVLLKDLGKKKVQTAKATRKQMFDYQEALSLLKR